MLNLHSWLRVGLWLICAVLSWTEAQAQNRVRLASDDWCPYVCSDGRNIIGGFLVDVTHEALASMGYRVEPTLLPLNRAMRMVEHGSIEGVYAPEKDPRLVNSDAVIDSRACFYTLPGNRWHYGGIQTLRDVTVTVIDDYGYDNGEFDAYVVAAQKVHSKTIAVRVGEAGSEINIKMLLSGRSPSSSSTRPLWPTNFNCRGHAAIRCAMPGACNRVCRWSLALAAQTPMRSSW